MAVKAAASLKHFFGHAADAGWISTDPARHLTKALQRSASGRSLRVVLTRAGFSGTELEHLSWRDMLPLTFGGAAPAARLEPPLRDELIAALLTQLRSDIKAAEIDTVLDQPIVSGVDTADSAR